VKRERREGKNERNIATSVGNILNCLANRLNHILECGPRETRQRPASGFIIETPITIFSSFWHRIHPPDSEPSQVDLNDHLLNRTLPPPNRSKMAISTKAGFRHLGILFFTRCNFVSRCFSDPNAGVSLVSAGMQKTPDRGSENSPPSRKGGLGWEIN